ncbi:hypothetical protein VPH35_129293 [Triticum aestivum]
MQVALPIVPCPDSGRNVVTYVARRGQNAIERFHKCRRHNVSTAFWMFFVGLFFLIFSISHSIAFPYNQWQPARGGCDFCRWQQSHAESLAAAAPPMAQIVPAQEQAGLAYNAADVHRGRMRLRPAMASPESTAGDGS